MRWKGLVRARTFKEPIKLITAGQTLLSKNLYAEAIEKFAEAINVAPNYSGGYTWRALALNLDGQSERALVDLGKAISLTANEQDNLVHYYSRASIQLETGHYLEAVADCNLAIAICEGRAAKNIDYIFSASGLLIEPDILINAYVCRAKAYKKLGETSLAKQSLDACAQALKAESNIFKEGIDRSLVYLELENWDGAIQCCNSMLKRNPQDATAYNNRGWAYLHIGEYSLALSDLDNAIGINSSVAAFYDTRAHIYEKLDKNELAVKDHAIARELGYKPSV